MKTCWLLGLSLAILLLAGPGSAQADPLLPGTPTGPVSLLVTADESCTSFAVLTPFPSGPILFAGPLLCVIAKDPISGKFVPTFTLPTAVTAGDILALEPVKPTGHVNSDLLRFIPNQADGSSTLMAYFSDHAAGETLPSDVGIPSLQSNNLTVTETTPETGPNAFFALVGSPSSQAIYQIRSDRLVPEPASILLLATGAGIVGLARWRHRNRLTT